MMTRGELPVDYIFSTIPITSLARCLSPQAPADIIEAVRSIRYRSMVLFYLILETDQFTPFDAHYFPGEDVVFSRLSETKNYYQGNQPKGLTGLCLEIPCSTQDAVWHMSDTELCDLVTDQLAASELPITSSIREGFSIRIDDVYPIYDIGYEPYFRKALDFVNAVPNLISLGRQGLFMHNNTHHSLAMAYRAGECLTDNLSWNQTQWASHLDAFSQFVVED
jgi:protoporphyrinogen oxidase